MPRVSFLLSINKIPATSGPQAHYIDLQPRYAHILPERGTSKR